MNAGDNSLVRISPDALPGDAFALSLNKFWEVIKSQKDLNLPAHKVCHLFHFLDAECVLPSQCSATGYALLKSQPDTQHSSGKWYVAMVYAWATLAAAKGIADVPHCDVGTVVLLR